MRSQQGLGNQISDSTINTTSSSSSTNRQCSMIKEPRILIAQPEDIMLTFLSLLSLLIKNSM